MYNKIEAKHTCTIIHNYHEGDCMKLERFFSIWNKVCFRYDRKAIRYNKDSHTLVIPRGYPLQRIEAMFNQNVYVNTDCDPYDTGIDIYLRYLPRDNVQKTAIKFILGEGEYSYTRGKSQLAINLNTGAGKTYVSIVSAAIMQMRAIMITSSKGWIEQWQNKIQEYTNVKEKEIYIIMGAGSIAKILNGMVKVNKIKYFLASHQTIKSYGDKYGWHKVGELFRILRVGIKIFDEAHLDYDNICDIDFSTDTYKTLYLTATPARSDKYENTIYQASFKTVPSIDLFDEEKDPHTHYKAISYTSHPTPMDIEGCRNQFGFSMHSYANYCVKKPEFYKLLRILIETAMKKDGKVLIYIGTNHAIEFVYNWIQNEYPELRDDVGIYTTLIKDNDLKEAQLEKKFILSTIKSCGAAMDIPGLELTILLAEPFRSEVLARQTLGRTRANNTTYIEIIDRGFRTLQSYYRDKLPIFEKYALDTEFIKLSDTQLNDLYYQALEKQHERHQEMYPVENTVEPIKRIKE